VVAGGSPGRWGMGTAADGGTEPAAAEGSHPVGGLLWDKVPDPRALVGSLQ